MRNDNMMWNLLFVFANVQQWTTQPFPQSVINFLRPKHYKRFRNNYFGAVANPRKPTLLENINVPPSVYQQNGLWMD